MKMTLLLGILFSSLSFSVSSQAFERTYKANGFGPSQEQAYKSAELAIRQSAVHFERTCKTHLQGKHELVLTRGNCTTPSVGFICSVLGEATCKLSR